MKIPKALSVMIRQIASIKQEQNDLNGKYSQLRQKIINTCKELQIENLTIQDGESEVRASVFDSVTISYDVDELRARFAPKVFRQLVDRHITIAERDLVDLARIYPDLKAKLSITYTSNPTKIEQAFNEGIITTKQLKGTFTTRSIPNLRISVK